MSEEKVELWQPDSKKYVLMEDGLYRYEDGEWRRMEVEIGEDAGPTRAFTLGKDGEVSRLR